jgi:hypothetical protein
MTFVFYYSLPLALQPHPSHMPKSSHLGKEC